MQSQFLNWLKWNFDALLTRYLPLSLSLSVSKSQSIYQYFSISPFPYTMFISCLFWQFIIHHSFRITLCDYRHRAYFRFHCHFRFRFFAAVLLLLRRLLLSLPLPFAFAFACFCCWLCFCLPALSVKFFYVLLLLSLSAALSAALLAALPLLPKHIKLSHRRVRRCRFAYGGNAPKSKFGAFVRALPLSLPLIPSLPSSVFRASVRLSLLSVSCKVFNLYKVRHCCFCSVFIHIVPCHCSCCCRVRDGQLAHLLLVAAWIPCKYKWPKGLLSAINFICALLTVLHFFRCVMHSEQLVKQKMRCLLLCAAWNEREINLALQTMLQFFSCSVILGRQRVDGKCVAYFRAEWEI